MDLHVIVGAGAVGSATAAVLAEDGHRVRVVSRRGTGPQRAGIELVAADATDGESLRRIVDGAAAVYDCANPPYQSWATQWPPLAASLLAVAEATGAVLVTMSNLYGYGPVDHPMVETDPLAATGTKGRVRAAMWQDAADAHRAGRVRATEARASDFIGPGLTTTSHLGRALPRLLGGRTVRVLGDPDAPHSWTYVPDVARTLAVLGTDERAWGRPWHVPTNPALSQRELIEAACRAAGVEPVAVRPLPRPLLRALGVAVPMLRELREVEYQFSAPFVVDSAVATATFGLHPTPMAEALDRIVGSARGPAGSAPRDRADRGRGADRPHR